jgi:hypothetical protein
MTTILRTITISLGLAAFAATFAPLANAGCVDVGPRPAAALGRHSGAYLMQAAYRPALFVPVADNNYEGAAIVGMWKIQMLAGGDVFDFGYQQWHSDGTEILNSGKRSPASENFCLGVWKKTGPNTYKLNHHALSYDPATGQMNAMVNIHEYVTLDRGGDTFSGTFAVDVYTPQGVLIPQAHFEGTITGERVTADQ